MKWEYGIAVMAAWNIAVFALYGIDKWKAKHQRWRVSESALLLCAFFGGALGALVGMEVFRHKTKKWKFRILVTVFLILQAAVALWIIR